MNCGKHKTILTQSTKQNETRIPILRGIKEQSPTDLLNTVEDGKSEVHFPPFSRGDASHHLRSIVNGLLAVKCALQFSVQILFCTVNRLTQNDNMMHASCSRQLRNHDIQVTLDGWKRITKDQKISKTETKVNKTKNDNTTQAAIY